MMMVSKICIKIKNFRFCIVSLLLVFCFFSLLLGCAKKKTEINPVKKECPDKLKKNAVPVEVVRARERQLQEILKFTGNIEGKNQVRVYPKVAGKLIEYKVQEGVYVKKKDVIALVDRDVTGFKFEPAPVESPISGIVAKTYLDRGGNVNPQMPVAVIADIDEVKVKIEISEVDYPKVKLGQIAKVTVDAYPGKEFIGKISKLSTLIDINTRTATAEIIITNQDHLFVPGMFARIRLLIEKHKCIVVPRDVVLRLPGTGVYYCFKVENGKAKKVLIELGMKQKNEQEIKNGVKAGDLIVLSGQGILQTGVPVEIKKKIEGETE